MPARPSRPGSSPAAPLMRVQFVEEAATAAAAFMEPPSGEAATAADIGAGTGLPIAAGTGLPIGAPIVLGTGVTAGMGTAIVDMATGPLLSGLVRRLPT